MVIIIVGCTLQLEVTTIEVIVWGKSHHNKFVAVILIFYVGKAIHNQVYYSSIEFIKVLLSSIWVEPAGVKGLWVVPVFWVVVVGSVADGDYRSSGNGVAR